MGNCHIWNGQVADLVAPIFQKQTFRGNPTDSLCSYLVLASYVVFPLFFHYFFQILGPCRAGAWQNPELEKDRTSGQDPQSRLAQQFDSFNSFNSFQSQQFFKILLLHAAPLEQVSLYFFWSFFAKAVSIPSDSDYFPSFYVGLWPLQRDHFWISIPHDSPSAKQLLRQEFHDIVAETPNSQTRCLQQGRSWNPGGLRVERGYWELPW